jgi:hypothetical protein
VTGPALLPERAHLKLVIPQITAPMRRYLQQVACVLRPGSVCGADLALPSFAAFLAERACGERLPADFPPWRTVDGLYQRWNVSRATVTLHDQLRAQARQAAGRNTSRSPR